eukprot:CAMPEP_0118916814 /NCGR_PEP_ID=MMETSP1166-20130328/16730_1 /TAXON_ID=1104430 /ORGANISM="Chrysoreinhardia sp, Strain CCMP3193" /LENGTH=280 /DNA_ID=CAMNT_0006856743 /DNA_START=6 /DNA_END=848 /DNA_ORIENTATION=+
MLFFLLFDFASRVRALSQMGKVGSLSSSSVARPVTTRRFVARAVEEDFDCAEECVVIRFVTGNAKKLREVTAILEDCGLPLPMEQMDLDLDELQSESPEKIAAAKCALAAEITGGPVLVDDTSLCLEALGGCPGPYVKWFCGPDKRPDIFARMLDGFEDKRAYATSCVAFAVGPKTVPLVFTGRVDGAIVEPSKGGVGWDNSFRPDGEELTFAEMSLEHKNLISHRSKALHNLSAYLHQHKDLLVRLCGDYQTEPAAQQVAQTTTPLSPPRSLSSSSSSS